MIHQMKRNLIFFFHPGSVVLFSENIHQNVLFTFIRILQAQIDLFAKWEEFKVQEFLLNYSFMLFYSVFLIRNIVLWCLKCLGFLWGFDSMSNEDIWLVINIVYWIHLFKNIFLVSISFLAVRDSDIISTKIFECTVIYAFSLLHFVIVKILIKN